MAPLPLSGSLLSDQHPTPTGEPTGPRIQEVLVNLIDYNQNNCDDHFTDGRPMVQSVYMLDTEQIDPLIPPFELLQVTKVKNLLIGFLLHLSR